MKKNIIVILILFSAAVMVPASSIEDDLSISLSEKRVRDLSPEGLSMVFYVNISSSSDKEYFLSGYSYRFLVNEQEYIDYRFPVEEGIRIQPRNKTMIALPVRITYSHLFQSIPGLEEKNKGSYTLIGWLIFSDGRREKGRFPIAFSGDFPFFREPSLVPDELRVNDMTIGGADIEISFSLKNPNDFELIVDRLSYTITTGGHGLTTGSVSGDKNVQPGEKKNFRIPILVNFFETGRDIAGFFRQTSAPFRISGEIEIHTLWGRMTLPLDWRGDLPVKTGD